MTTQVVHQSGGPSPGIQPLVDPGTAANGQPREANPTGAEAMYRVWACDNQVYGPIPLSILRQWTQETRVQRDTWIYLEESKEWRQASRIDELHPSFPQGEETAFLERHALEAKGIDVHELRQFAIFRNLPNHELSQLILYAELVYALPNSIMMRRGEPGDAVYFVLSGRMRARIHVGGDEQVLCKIGAGEFFGEMAMLTQGIRSADIVAESECRVLRFSAAAFRSLIEKSPVAAAPMLYSLSSLLASRVLSGNQRLQQEVASGFCWR